PTEDPSLSRMTLVTRGNDNIIEQITKQLNKLIDVVRLIDLADAPHIERELMLVKIKTTMETREEVKRMTDIFRGQIIDVTPTSYVVEMTGHSSKLDAFIRGLAEDSVIEVVRSGTTGISRGEKGLHL
ncbi:MAG: acetolactate synthase small subunit, partial [Methylomonas sp.]